MSRGAYYRIPYQHARGVQIVRIPRIPRISYPWYPHNLGRGTVYLGAEADEEDLENRAASAAAQEAVADLVAGRERAFRTWNEDRALSKEQMTQMMGAALQVARESEKNLTEMIEKVPSHFEGLLSLPRAALRAPNALGQAPEFEQLVAATQYPTVIPGFRAWIRRLLAFAEDGVLAIAHVAHRIPGWLRMRDILSKLHRAAVGVIDTAVNVVSSIPSLLDAIPTVAKVAGVAVIAGGLALMLSKMGKD